MAHEVRYATSIDGAEIAYALVGERHHFDLVYIPAWVSNVELAWEGPFARLGGMLDEIGRFARVATFDKRGTGLSSRAPLGAGPDKWLDDMRAVMDAARMERPVIYGDQAGGCALGALHAATHPERTRALILWAPKAKVAWAPDYPWGFSEESMTRFQDMTLKHWGTESWILNEANDTWTAALSDPEDIRFAARYLRSAATPRDAVEFDKIWSRIDVRSVLPTITVPTLVLVREGWQSHPLEGVRSRFDEARFVTSQIPDASLVEVPGEDVGPPWRDHSLDVVAEIQEFLTGARPVSEPDRVLATVMFTDIVESTNTAARLGDAAWKELLQAHDARARSLLDRFRGKEIDHAGDGFLVTFDGPARAVRCAEAIVEAVKSLGLQVRAGCHTGEVEVTPEGVRGIAVHIGARVLALAAPSEVLVSST